MRRSTIFACALLAGSALTGAAHAGVVFSDNFNTENGGVGTLNYTGFANWTVTSGAVDLIGNGFFDFLPGNGLYVDMDGSTGDAGTIASKTTFAPGNYVLSFDLAGTHRGPEASVKVSFGSLNETIALTSSSPFTTETFDVTVPGSGTLDISFASTIPGDIGALLDNVSVSTASPAIPEPGTLVLFASGIVLLGLMSFRGRRL